jgi:competence protein ComEC
MLAVFCVGRDNPFGHPHPAVVEDWASTGARVLRTDLLGNIFLHTDGEKLSVSYRQWGM